PRGLRAGEGHSTGRAAPEAARGTPTSHGFEEQARRQRPPRRAADEGPQQPGRAEPAEGRDRRQERRRQVGRVLMADGEQAKGGAAAATTTESPLLDTILSKGMRARDDLQRSHATGILGEFVRKISEGYIAPSKDVVASIDHAVAQIDQLLSAQLNEIMHAEEFKKLESTWRGLNYLVQQSETGPMLKIRVLNASKKDLLDDVMKAVEFDQSGLFKKVYEDEFGTPGGQPFGILVGDYEFGKHPQDVTLLEKVSNVAAAAFAPFISAASPQLFGWDSFQDLMGPRDLSMIFQSAEYIKYRSFRDSEDSRY